MKPPLFSCLSSRIANNGSLYGRFLLGPLPIDISLTVATVLRRSLLHSQATFSIVSAEIEGATHEYASLPGIQESVLEILLNLGEIVLTTSQRNFLNPNFRTSIGTAGFYFAFIRVTGPGTVTAKDINWPKGIFCVKPNLVICTLSNNETLTMRLKIACSLNKNKDLVEIEENIKSRTSDGINKDFNFSKAPKINKNALLNIESQGFETSTLNGIASSLSLGGLVRNMTMETNDPKPAVRSFIPHTRTSARFAFFAPFTLLGKEKNGELTGLDALSKEEVQIPLRLSKENSSESLAPKTHDLASQAPDLLASNQRSPLTFQAKTVQSTGLLAQSPSESHLAETKARQKQNLLYKKNQEFLINNQKQFNFFKFQENKQTLTSITSLESPDLITKTLLGSHFKKIKKKKLIDSYRFGIQLIKSKNIFKEEELDETSRPLNEFFVRKNEEEGSIFSYSYRKQNSSFEDIFNENRNQSIKNAINISNKNDENNVTFRVFPGLFNDFLEGSIKKQINQNQEIESKDIKIQRKWLLISKGLNPLNKNSNKQNSRIANMPSKPLTPVGLSGEQALYPLELSKETSSVDGKQSGNVNLSNFALQSIKPMGISSMHSTRYTINDRGSTPRAMHDHINESSKSRPMGMNLGTKSQELKDILFNKEIEKQRESLEVPPKKSQERIKHELLVSNSSYPVEKVNFLIERDDELAGYRHRIILEVWTNGSISPRQAIFESIGSIIKLIYNFREPLRNNFN